MEKLKPSSLIPNNIAMKVQGDIIEHFKKKVEDLENTMKGDFRLPEKDLTSVKKVMVKAFENKGLIR